jgi:putative membrane protein
MRIAARPSTAGIPSQEILMQRWHALVLAFVVGLIAASPAAAQTDPAALAERAIVRKAAILLTGSLDLARFGAERTKTPDVRAFAEAVATEHGKALETLKALAAERKVELPAKLDKPYVDTRNRLQKLPEAEFDRAFVAAMLTEHQAEIDAFAKFATLSKDGPLRGWLGEIGPVCGDHLERARRVQSAIAP